LRVATNFSLHQKLIGIIFQDDVAIKQDHV